MGGSKPAVEMTTSELILHILNTRPAMNKDYVALLEGKLADPRSTEIVLEVLARQIRGMRRAYEEFKKIQEAEPDIFCSEMAEIIEDYEVLCEVQKRMAAPAEASVVCTNPAPGIAL